MAEHDYVIANQNGANTRSDLNNALAAIVSNNSKASAPTTTYAYMWWADTANDILKQRNGADSAWISILTLSTGAPLATIANFTSTGIDDNATSTAITIDASENVTLTGTVNGLEINTTATSNLGLGTGAVDSITTGDFNVGVGDGALFSNTTASNNTSVGANSLFSNTTGIGNTAFGKSALYYNTTGTYNAAVGQALHSNTTGSSNTAMGWGASHFNTTGSENAAFGRDALQVNTTGSYNTGLGRSALYYNTTGANNTALGYLAGDNITTGSSNIIIGASVAAPSATASNQLNIGNTIYGNTSTGTISIGTTTANGLLNLTDNDAGDGGTIASFHGTDGNQSFYIKNYLCGSDEDRVGVQWDNQGILNQNMWCDDTGDIRVSGSNPTADNSGTVVGTQTFTGTHIYKSSDDTLVTGEAVKLVARKLVRCTTAKDPTCIGIFIGKSDKIVDSFGDACTYDYWNDETELVEVKNTGVGYPYAIASLGDTIANISGTKLEGVLVDSAVSAGDLLCTSITAGLLTKQDDDIVHSYTVAKAGEDGDALAPVYSYIYCG